jgi:hypothetical protein
MYSTERWRKYMMMLAERDSAIWRGPFIRGLVNRWADAHPDDPLKSVDMFFWMELTRLDGSTPAQKILLWQYKK